MAENPTPGAIVRPRVNAMDDNPAYRHHLRRAAAQKYARHGWSVFPVTPNQKDPPLVAWRPLQTKRPPREQVIRTFQRFPTANIGVVCGAVSGLTVLDIDIKPWEGKRGDLTLAAIVKEYGPLPDTPQQRTWSGGLQIFFQYAPGTLNSAGQIGHGLDVRSDGGYCLVSPSYVEKDGRSGVYDWIVPYTAPLAPMPDWLIDLIIASQQTRSTQSGKPRRDQGRNDTLFREGRRLHFRGRSPAEIADTLRRENAKYLRPLPENELNRLIQSVLTLSDRPDWGSV